MINILMTSTQAVMEGVLSNTPHTPEVGDVVEGPVIGKERSALFVDLHPYGTGIIYGREFMNARDILRSVSTGDTIEAKVVNKENEDGYIELSLREARQALIWGEVEEALKNNKVLNLEVTDANKGGLIVEWHKIQGFLPASQLKPEHYPHVEGGDKTQILAELQRLVGKTLSVSVLSADPEEGKLIFTEKTTGRAEPKEEIVKEYEEGDIITGQVTGVVDFGIFIKIEEGLEGLAHISELDWGLVEDPRDLFKIGDEVSAKVIEVKDDKISLSIKALKTNPWKDAKDKYEKGQEVEAVVIKYNEHGALASIEEGVAGLVHVSDFESMDELRDTLSLGMTYTFKITLFDPQERRMALTYQEDK